MRCEWQSLSLGEDQVLDERPDIIGPATQRLPAAGKGSLTLGRRTLSSHSGDFRASATRREHNQHLTDNSVEWTTSLRRDSQSTAAPRR